MRALIDAHMLGNQETGNETYITGLIQGFESIKNATIGAAISPSFCPEKSHPSIDILRLSHTNDWIRLLFSLPKLCRDWQADILHTTYISPVYLPCASVVSVHDISFKLFPHFFSPRDRLLLNLFIPSSLRRADGVITISSYSKNEILKYYPFLEGKVHVILLAPKPIYRTINENDFLKSVKYKFGINSTYLLFVGNLQPRKNLHRLIKAFSMISSDLNNVKLVVVGAAKWRSTDIFNLVRQYDLEDRLIFTGYVTDDELVALYNLAEAFVFPSLYEGFGLPIQEAMACGVPVICSNTASMPEVAGDAAFYVDPYNEDEIAGAMLEIVKNKKLAESLSNRGSIWVKNFSWKKVAQDTVELYKGILN
ncbi:MAG: glycosyltransferase family 1 protein [Anaerolineales bacterium]